MIVNWILGCFFIKIWIKFGIEIEVIFKYKMMEVMIFLLIEDNNLIFFFNVFNVLIVYG